jgi:hypothetical protein
MGKWNGKAEWESRMGRKTKKLTPYGCLLILIVELPD